MTMCRVWKLVLTGGPCGGKTTAQVKLSIVFYHKQLSADINMYYYTFKTSFVSPCLRLLRAIIVHFNIRRKLDVILYDT